MPSDRSVICLGLDQPWGHWQDRVFLIYPETQIDTLIKINVEEPFEIRVSAGCHLNILDTGNEFICHIGQGSYLHHFGTVKKAHFILDAHAILVHKNIVQHPQWEVSEVHIELAQEEARVDWGTGINLQKEEYYQKSIKIEHFAPRTHSECRIKSIIQDRGNLNFVCDTFVYENATKSTSHQKNLNHVLSAQGHVTALPRLHIFNKAIEASHGTATQPIPEEALFYLQTRGLSLQQAKQLYLESFFQEFYVDMPHSNGR